jgi:hypothetical protein
MVEECTTPIAATSSNILLSEYIVAGTGGSSQVGEAFEITNLSHCPVTLDGSHFSYCNAACTAGSARYMNFGAVDVIPPRGVYVAMREPTNPTGCGSPGADDPGLFGLRVSTLIMLPASSGGWFNNDGGSMRVASGAYASLTSGTTFDRIASYAPESTACRSTGYDARDQCGTWTSAADDPSTPLMPHQLGRLWHPCDVVVAPVPSMCR